MTSGTGIYGIKADVYRHSRDPKNPLVPSCNHDTIFIAIDSKPFPGLTEWDPAMGVPVYVIDQTPGGQRCLRIHGRSGQRQPFSGTFAYSSDERFSRYVEDAPIKIYDWKDTRP